MGARSWGVDGATAGLAASAALRWIVFRVVLRKEALRWGIVPQRRSGWKEREILNNFAIPAAMSGFSYGPASWCATAILVRQLNGYSELGLFTAAANLRNAMMFLPLLINNVMVSLLNNHKAEKRVGGFAAIQALNIRTTLISAGIGGCALAAAGPFLLPFFGRDFGKAYPVLLIMILYALLEASATAAYQLIQSYEKMWAALLFIIVPRDIALVIGAYLLAPMFGARGLALSYSLAWALALVCIWATANLTGISQMVKTEGKQPLLFGSACDG